jgi:hypothetical protein
MSHEFQFLSCPRIPRDTHAHTHHHENEIENVAVGDDREIHVINSVQITKTLAFLRGLGFKGQMYLRPIPASQRGLHHLHHHSTCEGIGFNHDTYSIYFELSVKPTKHSSFQINNNQFFYLLSKLYAFSS